jgi:hypothetical protein
MTRTPIFSDCHFTTDCKCAARSYEYEMTTCAVHRLSQAPAMFGVPPTIVVGLSEIAEDVNLKGKVVFISTRGERVADCMDDEGIAYDLSTLAMISRDCPG